MTLGYEEGLWSACGTRVPVSITLSKKTSHVLISGKSGSGKSQSALWYIGQVLWGSEGRIFISDYKAGEEYAFLEGSPSYASGPDALQLIEKFYDFYTEVRSHKIRLKKYHALFIEEWFGLLTFAETQDKKLKSSLMGKVAEILAVGRGLNLGVFLVIQRPDAALFQSGSREQFQCVINFGKCSAEAFKMLGYSGELAENPTFAYQPGQALVYIDGQDEIQEIIVPLITNSHEMRRQIRLLLDKQPDIAVLTQAAAQSGGRGQ